MRFGEPFSWVTSLVCLDQFGGLHAEFAELLELGGDFIDTATAGKLQGKLNGRNGQPALPDLRGVLTLLALEAFEWAHGDGLLVIVVLC
jgi:hypothetical protein